MKRGILLALLLWGMASTAQAEGPAGMVLYFRSGDDVFLLLSDDARQVRGWAAFGGGAHDSESYSETAARETHEETRGYFAVADLLEKIEAQDPLVDAAGFALFFAEVDFVPAQRVTNQPKDDADRSFGERGQYAWIPWSAVHRHLSQEIDRTRKYPVDPDLVPPCSGTNWFWETWLRNMRQAVQEDAIPW